jgi:hypothetical protein
MASETGKAPALETLPDEDSGLEPALPPERGGEAEPGELDLDPDRVDALVLATLLLTAHRNRKHDPWRSWKGVSWEASDRLFEKGYIADPKSKAKSVVLTEAGFKRGREVLQALCRRDGG